MTVEPKAVFQAEAANATATIPMMPKRRVAERDRLIDPRHRI
jgi:hypothetical protein